MVGPVLLVGNAVGCVADADVDDVVGVGVGDGVAECVAVVCGTGDEEIMLLIL